MVTDQQSDNSRPRLRTGSLCSCAGYAETCGVRSADKRSQLTQLALLWSTSSCINWMQVWRMGYAGELDSWKLPELA